MEKDPVTFCLPDHEKSCFACCPPIRPAGYEHARYGLMIRRILRENTAAFDRDDRSIAPITGFSCWGLGYLDRDFRLVGCLLHPARNSGVDLRYRVDYGEKCRREVCPEAKTFSSLKPGGEQEFWLRLADGLDAFSYSSRRVNPLFGLMGWGCHLLGLIAREEGCRPYTRDAFFRAYPFFSAPLLPGAHAYLIKTLVRLKGTGILKTDSLALSFEGFSKALAGTLKQACGEPLEGEPVHRLDLDGDFLNFLRLSVPVRRLSGEDALRLKEMVDKELDMFASRID